MIDSHMSDPIPHRAALPDQIKMMLMKVARLLCAAAFISNGSLVKVATVIIPPPLPFHHSLYIHYLDV